MLPTDKIVKRPVSLGTNKPAQGNDTVVVTTTFTNKPTGKKPAPAFNVRIGPITSKDIAFIPGGVSVQDTDTKDPVPVKVVDKYIVIPKMGPKQTVDITFPVQVP